jgi:hypothetical protein
MAGLNNHGKNKPRFPTLGAVTPDKFAGNVTGLQGIDGEREAERLARKQEFLNKKKQDAVAKGEADAEAARDRAARNRSGKEESDAAGLAAERLNRERTGAAEKNIAAGLTPICVYLPKP